jgi:hypothetical protein
VQPFDHPAKGPFGNEKGISSQPFGRPDHTETMARLKWVPIVEIFDPSKKKKDNERSKRTSPLSSPPFFFCTGRRWVFIFFPPIKS